MASWPGALFPGESLQKEAPQTCLVPILTSFIISMGGSANHHSRVGILALVRLSQTLPPTETIRASSLHQWHLRAQPLTSKVTGGMRERRWGDSGPSCSKALTCGRMSAGAFRLGGAGRTASFGDGVKGSTKPAYPSIP